MQYAMQIIMAFLMMSIMFIMVPRASVSAERIAEVLQTPVSIVDPVKPVRFTDGFQPTIEFRHVNFRYPGGQDDVLHDINFCARAGQVTAIIGSTGSGKSTLVNLLCAFMMSLPDKY
jgi:ATP-binding cassette subfamily B protein